MKFALVATSALAATALTLSACGSDSVDAAADTSEVVAEETGDAVVEELSIEGIWARESPAMADAGAAYMVITSPVDDRLVGASADVSIAGRVEVHEVVMADDAMKDDSMTDDSMTDDTAMADEMSDDTAMAEEDHSEMEATMVMQQVEAIELPAGEAVALEPGGYHIMLLELVEPLVTGQSFDLTLDFANAGPVTVSVEVRTEAP